MKNLISRHFVLLLAVIAMPALSGCEIEEDVIRVEPLEISLQHMEILGEGSLSRFCRAQDKLWIQLFGTEYSYNVMANGGKHLVGKHLYSKGNITEKQYKSGYRYEPCSAFAVSIFMADQSNNKLSTVIGSMNGSCEVTVNAQIPPGRKALFEIRHPEMAKPYHYWYTCK